MTKILFYSKVIKKLFLTKNFDYIILSLFFVIIVFSNIVWLKIDTQPPHWDAARHFWTSLHYKQIVFDGEREQSKYLLKELSKRYYYYPPFFYLTTLPIYFIAKSADAVTLSANIFYIFILIFSTYGIGKIIWNRKTGILASAFISVSPMILSFFREYQLDMPLTAMVALSFYLLLKSQQFSRLKYSILLGFSLAGGMLTKWTFPIFIIGPIIFIIGAVIIQALKQKNKIKYLLLRIGNACICFLVLSILSFPWYWYNRHQLKIDFTNNGSITVNKGAYLTHMINSHTYLALFVFITIGVIITFTLKNNFKKNTILLFSIATIFALMQKYIKNTDARYMLPWLVYGSILASFWLTNISNKLFKNFITSIFIIIMVVNFFLVSFGLNFLPQSLPIRIGQNKYTLFHQGGYTSGRPVTENWQIENILSDIAQDSKNQNIPQPIKLTSQIDDHIRFNNWGLIYYSLLHNTLGISYDDFNKIYWSDYIITRFDNADSEKKFILEKEREQKDIGFELFLVNEYPLPNQTKAQLYRINILNDRFSFVPEIDNLEKVGCNCQIIYDDSKIITGNNNDIILFGPYIPLKSGNYQLSLWAKTTKGSSIPANQDIGNIKVYNYEKNIEYGNSIIFNTNFDLEDRWTKFIVNFNITNTDRHDKLEFVLISSMPNTLKILKYEISPKE